MPWPGEGGVSIKVLFNNGVVPEPARRVETVHSRHFMDHRLSSKSQPNRKKKCSSTYTKNPWWVDRTNIPVDFWFVFLVKGPRGCIEREGVKTKLKG